MATEPPSARSRSRWPWWRCLCAAFVPWGVGILVSAVGAPGWAAFGFGINAFIMAMVGAAVADAIRDVRNGLAS